MSGAGSRIASVQAYVLVGDKDYVGGAGLTSIATTDGLDSSRTQAAQGRRALADVGDLHICAYPPQAQTCLVKITADDGTVGWGEGHAPLGPRATQAVVERLIYAQEKKTRRDLGRVAPRSMMA